MREDGRRANTSGDKVKSAPCLQESGIFHQFVGCDIVKGEYQVNDVGDGILGGDPLV